MVSVSALDPELDPELVLGVDSELDLELDSDDIVSNIK